MLNIRHNILSILKGSIKCLTYDKFQLRSDNKGYTMREKKKNNVLSADKQSNKLHTAVSIAFSYLHQCRVKTGGKMLLFIVLTADSTEGGGAKR